MDFKDLSIGPIITKVINDDTNIYELINASFQRVRKLFVLAYDAADDN